MSIDNTASLSTEVAARQHWMSVLARADEDGLEQHLKAVGRPDYRHLRAPEIGLAMVRGRTGGTGNPFNLGETTLTRCVIELATGTRGFGYVQGRSRRHAELAAVFDALLQDNAGLQTTVIEPLHNEWLAARRAESCKAAATRVNFMTMVRGE
ncbi:phosphonate C-P lyase system protein PhnG [Marinobacter sp. SS5-14b]|uniref:phosphonate C-P lyase system protein PhnG n=1 Tax=Marinobacter sp. SS5-14b TaxID=3050456 RepID=UPI0026DEB773|nr:phosphonate C-P lyase system protein PhnG [Marinobacter sp. SS5-14b]